jgi:hypothetical protein
MLCSLGGAGDPGSVFRIPWEKLLHNACKCHAVYVRQHHACGFQRAVSNCRQAKILLTRPRSLSPQVLGVIRQCLQARHKPGTTKYFDYSTGPFRSRNRFIHRNENCTRSIFLHSFRTARLIINGRCLGSCVNNPAS